MKKLIVLIVAFSITFTACKKKEQKEQKKQETPQTTKKDTALYSLNKASKTIGFTAYKTTDKVGVNGKFTKIEITNNCEGNIIKDALNGAEFKISVSSLETEDDSRNLKIRQFFFGVMENSLNLTGQLKLTDEKSGELTLTMNNNTEKLPIEYSIEGKKFSMKGVLNIENWKATKALESLNKACFDLHKGKDGVSKTWSEVAINATVSF